MFYKVDIFSMRFNLLFSYNLLKTRITWQQVRKNVLLITYEKYLLHVQHFLLYLHTLYVFLNKQHISNQELMACLCIFQHSSPEQNNAHSGYLGYAVYIQTVTIFFI